MFVHELTLFIVETNGVAKSTTAKQDASPSSSESEDSEDEDPADIEW